MPNYSYFYRIQWHNHVYFIYQLVVLNICIDGKIIGKCYGFIFVIFVLEGGIVVFLEARFDLVGIIYISYKKTGFGTRQIWFSEPPLSLINSVKLVFQQNLLRGGVNIKTEITGLKLQPSAWPLGAPWMVDPVRGADRFVFITVSQSRSVQQDIIRKPDKLYAWPQQGGQSRHLSPWAGPEMSSGGNRGPFARVSPDEKVPMFTAASFL